MMTKKEMRQIEKKLIKKETIPEDWQVIPYDNNLAIVDESGQVQYEEYSGDIDDYVDENISPSDIIQSVLELIESGNEVSKENIIKNLSEAIIINEEEILFVKP